MKALDKLLAIGYTQKQISVGLGICRQTIGRHLEGQSIGDAIHERADKLLLFTIGNSEVIPLNEYKTVLIERFKQFEDGLK